MAKQLKKSTIDASIKDPHLFAKLTEHFGVKPSTVQAIIIRNGNQVNRYDTIQLIAEHLNIPMDECMEDVLVVHDTLSAR